MQDEQRITGITPKPQDRVDVEVAYSAGKAYFTVCDRTQNKCARMSESTPSPDNQVEWIAEKPGRHIDIMGHEIDLKVALSNYNYLDVSRSCYMLSQDSSLTTYGPGHNDGYGYPVTMVNDSKPLSEPGQLVDETGDRCSDFKMYWKAYE